MQAFRSVGLTIFLLNIFHPQPPPWDIDAYIEYTGEKRQILNSNKPK